MTDRIRTLVKRITETRPVQSARRQALLQELRELRQKLAPAADPSQVHSLDAALLLMEFMGRSEDMATAETLQIVAGLVASVDEKQLLADPAPSTAPPEARAKDVAEHGDLRLTQEFLLGSILLQAGNVSAESLARALQLHASSGMPLGQCLIQLGAATLQQIRAAIGYQDRLRENERTQRAPENPPSLGRSDMRLSKKQEGLVKSIHSQVLGEILIRLGAISREQLERALQVQRAASLHVGEALVETGATTWDQIKRGLDVQRQLRRNAA